MSNHDESWLTIREAAAALGVSDLTIRRRIKDGKIAHRLDNGKYFVHLSLPVSPIPPQPPDPGLMQSDQSEAEYSHDHEYSPVDHRPESPAPLMQIEAVLPEYAKLAERAGRAGLLEEQYAQLQARYQTLEHSLVSLATRNGWLESKLEEREQEVRLLTDSQKRTPWWKRLFGAGS